jgi:hypothetical protein
MMKLILLAFVAIGLWNVEARMTKRMDSGWQEAWVYIGREVCEEYFGENAANAVEQSLEHCLAQEGNEWGCFQGEMPGLGKLLSDDKQRQKAAELAGALFALGETIHGDCHQEKDEEIMDCAGKAVEKAGFCCGTPDNPFQGYEQCQDLDWECLFFLKVVEEKATEYMGKQHGKKSLVDHLRALMSRNIKRSMFQKRK